MSKSTTDPGSASALSSLRELIAVFGASTRGRGESYFQDGAIIDLARDENLITATVRGTLIYTTRLLWEDGEWWTECSCPVEFDCKHTYATARAWLASCKSGPSSPESHIFTTQPRSKKKQTFRQQWTPILAAKLGRSLDEGESRLLGRLSGLYAEMRNGFGRLTGMALIQHGFPAAHPIDQPWKNPYEGWWDKPPADPWELWQYIAYDWERAGHPLPEVFRPMTNTAAVATRIEQLLLQRELDGWRRSFDRFCDRGDSPQTTIRSAGGLRLILQPKGFFVETRPAENRPWKSPSAKWLNALPYSSPADFTHLEPAAQALGIALAAECRGYTRDVSAKRPLPETTASRVLAYPACHGAIFLADGSPWRIEPQPLVLQAVISPFNRQRLELELLTPDGCVAADAQPLVMEPEPLYHVTGRIFRGPPPPPHPHLPIAALDDSHLASHLRAMGMRLPESLKIKVRRVAARPILRCWLSGERLYEDLCIQLLATSEQPDSLQHWTGSSGWQWTEKGPPTERDPDGAIFEFDLEQANAASSYLNDFKLAWSERGQFWRRSVTRTFAPEFTAWIESLPRNVAVEAQGNLDGLLAPPLRASIDFSAIPAVENPRDWFDLTVEIKVEDVTLTPEEIALLLKARGKWVRLPLGRWSRLAPPTGGEALEVLDRLGLGVSDTAASGRPTVHRMHAMQLAAESDAIAKRDQGLAAALRERVTLIAATPLPEPPPALQATLRPYQREGFQFLGHLSALGFGGILADDMGLGKTVQTLAWLLHLAEAPILAGGTRSLRALVICPKSVIHGWLGEAVRFTPSLRAVAFSPAFDAFPPSGGDSPSVLVAHYTQLRLHAAWFQSQTWDAVVLDEAQFIKNPASKAAATARGLRARHRVALSGTPIENRLLDLWSIFAFAQPGLLGSLASFKRSYSEDDPLAPERLRRRVRHFMLRRTKGQVATELPPRIEGEILVELDGQQQRLYDAELKRARARLLGIETNRQLDKARFNILASLLRLRQICCHPALADPAHSDLPSAKLDALIERLEELRDEGHQVLVFSQFVGMLEIIRDRLAMAGIGSLMLTGQTDDRSTLVQKFQTDPSYSVFLLSLKAAAFGLNLTAASYTILYDPWWNPAVEAQAIDRAHRIGQTQTVFAYRLLAANTIEEKIRSLQREKSALAGSIVQEESLTRVLDLDSLRRILM